MGKDEVTAADLSSPYLGAGKCPGKDMPPVALLTRHMQPRQTSTHQIEL
jgi:hypothetical protein